MPRPTVRSFLVVVLLLTLLVSLAPFAQAAPEYVSAVTITSPTTAAKAYVHAGGPLQVAYTVTTTDTTGPARANFYLGSTSLATDVAINLPILGVNNLTQALTIPGGTAEATYDVMVEVRQDVVQSNWVQAVQNYAVVVDNTPPTIKTTTLTVPNGGESWMLGSAKTITWATLDVTDTNFGATPIGLYLSMDGGATWPTQITAGVANGGSFAWTVGGGIGTQMRVKIVATDIGRERGPRHQRRELHNLRHGLDSACPDADRPGYRCLHLWDCLPSEGHGRRWAIGDCECSLRVLCGWHDLVRHRSRCADWHSQ